MVKIYKMIMIEFHTFKGQWANLMLHMKVLDWMLDDFSKEWKEGFLTKPPGFYYITVRDSQSMHWMWAINASNNAFLEVREFSCFCHHSIDVVLNDYTSKGYVEPWRLITLKPYHESNVLCDVEYDDNDWGVGVNKVK